jgi:hypothetical protein
VQWREYEYDRHALCTRHYTETASGPTIERRRPRFFLQRVHCAHRGTSLPRS